MFQIADNSLNYSNFTKEEYQAKRSLAHHRSIAIKKADKRCCAVTRDRDDYLSEAEKQLCNKAIYKDASFNEKILSDLVISSNEIFKRLQKKGAASEKEIIYFFYDYKNAPNLGKSYFLTKIHNKFFKVPGHNVISNYGTLTEKAFQFLYHDLKLVMQSSWSYIKDPCDFLIKIKHLSLRMS